MTKYKIQYWLYAILNSKFGSEVKFTRDSLHSMYEVNRHGFEISTNTMNLSLVESWLEDKLISSDFSINRDYSFEKSFVKLENNQQIYISLRKQDRGAGYQNRNKAVLYVHIGLYKK